MKTKVSLVIFSCLLSIPAMSADLYVNATGVDGDCLARSPCASIQAAINVSAPGDSIHIAEGQYFENVTIPAGKNGLHISGAGESTKVISAGGDLVRKEAPIGVPIDVVFDIFATDTTIEKLSIEHPPGIPNKRDLGVFVRPPAQNTTIQKNSIKRNRTGSALEPTRPGSRGVFVVQAKGVNISKNNFSGNYEDHLHIPSSNITIDKNNVVDAKRIGIVIIQETPTSDSTNNMITNNTVLNSGADGIQIQGDENIIAKNAVVNSGGAGIRLCGAGDCVAPGITAVASGNSVTKNELENNSAGNVVDNGSGNTVR